jgi:hypothetical protein
MKKQTAIEFLIGDLFQKGLLKLNEDALKSIAIADEMFEQQIIDAHGSKLKNSRGTTNYEYWYTGEQYFNETY